MIYPWPVFSDGEKLVSGQKITSIKNRILSNDVYIELLNVPELVYVTFEFLKRTQLQVGFILEMNLVKISQFQKVNS